jgi:hypothetical protein
MSEPWFGDQTPADFVWLLDIKRGLLHRFHKADAESDIVDLIPSCTAAAGRDVGINKAQLVGQCDPVAFAMVTCTKCLVEDIAMRYSNCEQIGCCPEPEWPPAPVSAPAAG